MRVPKSEHRTPADLDKLLRSGLFVNGLTQIDTDALADRYNACLQAAGLEPTALRNFHVDGIGWSPEVATEKNDRQYLTHGAANQLAIIVTPDQRGKPIHFPQYSFVNQIMKRYFDRFSEEIADITTETGLCLDIDFGLSVLGDPNDLFLVDKAGVTTAVAGPQMEAARHQRELVTKFTQAGNGWFNPELRSAILQSAREFGDLRHRKLVIPQLPFAETNDFYAVAFGGVFLFRHLTGPMDLLIFEQIHTKPVEFRPGFRSICLEDPDLPELLHNKGLVDLNPDWYNERHETVECLWDCLLADAIAKYDPGEDYAKLSSIRKKAYVKQLGRKLPDVFFHLERFRAELKRPGFVRLDDLNYDLGLLLMHPRIGLPENVRDLVWRLLCRISPQDVVRTYRRDRNLFFEQFSTWPEARQQWAAALIGRYSKGKHV